MHIYLILRINYDFILVIIDDTNITPPLLDTSGRYKLPGLLCFMLILSGDFKMPYWQWLLLRATDCLITTTFE